MGVLIALACVWLTLGIIEKAVSLRSVWWPDRAVELPPVELPPVAPVEASETIDWSVMSDDFCSWYAEQKARHAHKQTTDVDFLDVLRMTDKGRAIVRDPGNRITDDGE